MKFLRKGLLLPALIITISLFILGQSFEENREIAKVNSFSTALLASIDPKLTLVTKAKENTLKTKTSVRKSKADVQNPKKASRKLRLIASRDEGVRFIWPARGGINSPFGERWGRIHEGIDIDGSTGDPVRASRDGVVTFAGWEDGYGKLIVLDHAGPYKTRYGHLSKILVREGQRVEAGDIIGLIGSTGRSTGSHLHFEILINGNPVNPLKYLP
ncbi:M23 family metallopeptidase [Carboxydothermus ferrireducens]|uniref:Murein DD-endopeptidase MepM/ murein hydrolase activator NlpD n=1 Tax=Carboxydothermus ferrireducens DSM 11255 TaxID=1119529 RepID=A0ABX2RCN5_9THEO|nr:M23 family metallopeptidase [Carboxydothermus ferrireducens]NYE57640.1 murein DD-endopeptidase MepM/ murein hydrolase activator NlpD [Carboxydothermus ferrireducens DSM 11255]